MAENVFEAVKLSVSTREAAEFYGIKVRRNGMACCPFHDDKNPSMKVDQRFHCFGCGEDGDVIDFTAKLFDLSPKEAAEKLAQDFGLIYDSQAPPRRRYVRQKKRGTEVSGGSTALLSRTVRLLLSAEKMGSRPFSQDTGGRTAPPLCGSNPEESLCRVPAGPFSL